MPQNKFPGWRVVAGCFLILVTGSGLAFYGLAVYLNAFAKEFGWDVSSISIATTFFFLVAGVSGVYIARLIEQFDVRWVLTGGSVIASLSLASLSLVREPWQLFVVYGVFSFGFAGAGLIPATTVVTRWFQRRRSVALSVASTGLSVGGIVMTPGAKWLLDTRGIGAGTPWLGVIFFVGTVPFVWWLIRPAPEALGWLPDGEVRTPGAQAPPPTGTPLARAVASRFFLATTIGYVFALGSQVGGVQQLVKLAEERTDADTAAFATLVLAATSVIARLIGGVIAERLPMIAFTVAIAGLQGVAMLLIATADSTWLLFASISLFGATIGNLLMLQPLLLARRFGVRDYGRIFSRSQFFTLAGTAGGPLILGTLRDVTGDYTVAYLVGAGLSVAGAIVIFLAGSADVADDEPTAGLTV